MTINMWGNFVWWPQLYDKPIFEAVFPSDGHDQEQLERTAFTKHMDWVKGESQGPSYVQWISKPVCIKVEIPSSIVNDMPERPRTEVATGEVEVSDGS